MSNDVPDLPEVNGSLRLRYQLLGPGGLSSGIFERTFDGYPKRIIVPEKLNDEGYHEMVFHRDASKEKAHGPLQFRLTHVYRVDEKSGDAYSMDTERHRLCACEQP